ncbi:TlpA family protein disulfide reductase [Coprobacter sp.]
MKPFSIKIVIFFVSFVLSLLIMPLRGGYVSIGSLTAFPLAILAYLVLYFLLTFVLLRWKGRQLKPLNITVLILIGSSLLELPASILEWKATIISFLDLPCRWIAIFTAYFFYHWSAYNLRKFILLLLYAIFGLWVVLRGFDLWSNKLTFGTFTGKVTEKEQPEDIFLEDNSGSEVSINSLAGKYILLNFWSSTCGYCFAEFPDLQKLYEQKQFDDNIKIYSVHCYLKDFDEDYITGRELLVKRNYSFPVLSINMREPVLKMLEVTRFPTVLIFDPQRQLVFRGTLDFAEEYLQTITK